MRTIHLCLATYGFVVFAVTSGETIEDAKYWRELAMADMDVAFSINNLETKAKNVILFVGDGLGPNTLTAARIYGKGEMGYMSFEKFPHMGALKTYSANKLVPDSCSTATAMFTGVKANHKTSGVDQTVAYADCSASLNNATHLESIFNWAQAVGKSTGFVTTTRVTHATPSALYAHTPDRKWECEATIPKDSSHCRDIAKQLVEDLPGRNIEVIFGGGRQCLQSNVSGSDADPIDTWSCYSVDGRDLIGDWMKEKEGRGVTYAVVNNTEQLESVDVATEYVLGIFANGHLKMDYERDKSPKGMPSLKQMTVKAIELLSKNENGYILMVEGGLIDFAHHRGHARQALDETVAFSDAISAAVDLTKPAESETLIIVTSDHSHSLVFTGYPDRGDGVLGVASASKMDSVNYTSLLYGTGGPDNYQYKSVDGVVVRPSPENTDEFTYAQQAAVLTDEVTHSGTDVFVFAKGPYAHLFTSVHEQTYVAYVIAYAAEIGPFAGNVASYANFSIVLLVFLGLVLILFEM